MNEFQDKVVLVTGAGRGLGKAVAKAFAERGAIVAANDINPLSLDALVEQCTVAGGRVTAYCFDVAKRMPVMALVSQVLEDWGHIEILIHNAAVEPVTGLLEMDEWDWHRTIDVNLSGAFFVIQQVGRVMRQQGGGAIVTIGANPNHTQPMRSAYLASKAGLLNLTQQAAVELAGDNIRVNAVCPRTTGVDQGQSAPVAEAAFPREDVDLILFLCSQEAAQVTGKLINCVNK